MRDCRIEEYHELWSQASCRVVCCSENCAHGYFASICWPRMMVHWNSMAIEIFSTTHWLRDVSAMQKYFRCRHSSHKVRAIEWEKPSSSKPPTTTEKASSQITMNDSRTINNADEIVYRYSVVDGVLKREIPWIWSTSSIEAANCSELLVSRKEIHSKIAGKFIRKSSYHEKWDFMRCVLILPGVYEGSRSRARERWLDRKIPNRCLTLISRKWCGKPYQM